MAGKLKPLDIERKIRPGKSLYEPSGVNPCPRPDWASQNVLQRSVELAAQGSR
jgi:hypothetical protein